MGKVILCLAVIAMLGQLCCGVVQPPRGTINIIHHPQNFVESTGGVEDAFGEVHEPIIERPTFLSTGTFFQPLYNLEHQLNGNN